MLCVQTVLLKKCYEIEAIETTNNPDTSIIKTSNAIDRLNSTLSKLFTAFIIYFFIFMFYKGETLTTITGSLSAAFEACLPLPQFISNFRNKSVESVRLSNKLHNDIHVGLWGSVQIRLLPGQQAAGSVRYMCLRADRGRFQHCSAV